MPVERTNEFEEKVATCGSEIKEALGLHAWKIDVEFGKSRDLAEQGDEDSTIILGSVTVGTHREVGNISNRTAKITLYLDNLEDENRAICTLAHEMYHIKVLPFCPDRGTPLHTLFEEFLTDTGKLVGGLYNEREQLRREISDVSGKTKKESNRGIRAKRRASTNNRRNSGRR